MEIVEETTINHTGQFYLSRGRGTGVEKDGNGGRRDGFKGESRLVGRLRTQGGGGDSSKTMRKDKASTIEFS